MHNIANILCYALIIYGSSMMGFTIARNYAERPRQLQALLTGVQILLTEIVYAATPLSEALQNLSRSCDTIGAFFSRVAQEIDNLKPARIAWEEGLEQLQAASALLAPDIEALRALGDVIGTSDREDQQRHLLLASRRIEGLHQSAVNEAAKNERLWRYLGVLAGIVAVIIIF
ncbi:MAG: stage III sporulation protein AB [Bacillota bacterium]|nr:MAG: stage III sporulation protein AB [Bacillota bacterium]MBS3949930.1 stage III sporulation protein AB [Peptococcaceae bacterium]